MPKDLKEITESVLKTEISVKNEDRLKKLINELFLRRVELATSVDTNENDITSQKILCDAMKKLRSINNRKNNSLKNCDYSLIRLDDFLEEICFCADILLSDCNRSVVYSAEPISVACCPPLITDTLLNLISNSVKFGRQGNINVTLKRKNNYCEISVKNETDKAEYSVSYGSGLKASQNIAKLHGGRLLYSCGKNCVSSIFTFNDELPEGERYTAPSFPTYLEDNLSPVYIGLCDTGIRI